MKIILFTICYIFSSSIMAQNCNDAVTSTTPNERFNVHDNETVTDKKTKLMWKRCSEGLTGIDCKQGKAIKLTWDKALQQAENSSFAEHDDWRLPNIKELASIVELSCYKPAINLIIFPNTIVGYYWSGSPVAANSTSAWVVFFRDGYDYWSSRGSAEFVRFVRERQ